MFATSQTDRQRTGLLRPRDSKTGGENLDALNNSLHLPCTCRGFANVDFWQPSRSLLITDGNGSAKLLHLIPLHQIDGAPAKAAAGHASTVSTGAVAG